jgi:hypothetical protein
MTAYTEDVEVSDPIQQLSRLLAVNDRDGTWSGGPSGFLWDITIERYRPPPAVEGRTWLVANWTEFDPEGMWRARGDLGVDLATLVICRNRNEFDRCFLWFVEHDIDHIAFCPEGDEGIDGGDAVEPGTGHGPPDTARQNRRRRTPRPVLPRTIEPWLRFQDGECKLCLTTEKSVHGLQWVGRLQLIYTFCPSVALLGHTDMGSNNILVCALPRERRKVLSLPEGFQEWIDV